MQQLIPSMKHLSDAALQLRRSNAPEMSGHYEIKYLTNIIYSLYFGLNKGTSIRSDLL
jgi:hypothetical protein